MAKPHLDIVIVTYNSREEIDACLQSILHPKDPKVGEILVVDNASPDGTADYVQDHYPDVTVISLTENLGFAGANNVGIDQSAAPFVLLLNPDTIVQPGAFPTMLKPFEQDLRIGLVGPKLRNTDGTLQPSCREFPTLLSHLIGMSEMYRWPFFRKIWGQRIKSLSDHTKAARVDWVSGAVMLTRREAVKQVGGLDTRYFMYTEELDWQYRLSKAGWGIWFEPGAEVIHIGGASTRRVPARRIIWQYESLYQFYKTHKSRLEYGLLRCLVFSLTLPKVLFLTITGRHNEHRKTLRSAFWKIIWMG